MREIKFRAWFRGKMIKPMSLQEMIHQKDNTIPLKVLEKEIIFMQSIGLKDKNGLEIYEGDILKLKESKEKYEVRYLGNRFVLCKYDNIVFEDEAYFSEREVIGNIYENKELLNK